MRNKKVFISGGAGVIGRELISLLIRAEAEVFVGDLKPCPSEFKSLIKYRQGDLNNITLQEIKDFSPEIFFHLAATFERSEENYEFWEENSLHNVNLTHHLIGIVKDLKSIKKIIYASSYLIYDPDLYQFDRPQEHPFILKESDPIYPRNLTGVAKLSHEIDLRFLNKFKHKSYQTISARIFRGYGCNSRDVISRWIRDLLNKKSITVYKEEGIFDYIYAADTAKGLYKLSESKNFSGIINLGTGRGRKVKEILNILNKYFPDMRVIKKESDIRYESSQANIDLLKKEINWSPEYDLETTIPLIINYEKERINKPKNDLQTPKVLLTSAGGKSALFRELKKALKKYSTNSEIICADIKKDCISKFIADEFWEMPETSDENFDLIVDLLKEKKINIILPTRDGELKFWSKNLKKLNSSGIEVIISPPEGIDICLDKLKFYEFGRSHGFNFIKSSQDINLINSDKFTVKEQFGSGSEFLGLNLTKKEAIEYSKKLNKPIFQPFIKGKEISIDSWISKSHKVKGNILRTRDLVINGESKVTTTFFDQELEKKVKRILEALKLRGPVVLQGIVKTNGEVIFIECNSRFGGGSDISLKAGLDSLYWSILEIQGEDLDSYLFNKSTSILRKVRVQEDIYLEI